MKKSKKGESVRTETLTARFTPKIKYGAELLARKHHRTLAGVLEWAVSEKIDEYLPIDPLWDADPEKRIRLLKQHAPHLLTYEEEIWLRDNP